MTLKFYNVTEDKRKLIKTLTDSGGSSNLLATLTGSIKRDTSVIDPEFETTYNADIFKSNYIYAADLRRYYYITNITVSAQRLYIQCHVDVLMSYSSDIKKLRCVVERQEKTSKCNLYLTDQAYKAEQRHILRTQHFKWGGTKAQFTPGASSYVLTTGGTS